MRVILLGIILLAVVLSGCAHTKDVVNIPVPVKCQTPEPDRPSYRFSPPYADVFEGTRDLLGDREISLKYEESLRTALKSCK